MQSIIPAGVSSALRSLAMVSAIVVIAAGSAHAGKKNFMAVLNAGQEVPPNASSAIGNGFMTYDPATAELCYAISYVGLSSPESGAHFHHAASPGVDGTTLVEISPNPSPFGSPKQGCVTLDSAAASALVKGQVYINIHSEMEPGGEIRGQVIPVKGK